MNKWTQHLCQSLAEAGVSEQERLVVAASGGVDSTVLLHLLHELGRNVVVGHVNHHARGEASDLDQQAVEAWCEERNWTCEVLHLDPEALAQGEQGFQGEARKQRMAWLETLRSSHGASAILTGHHADDQAETWLLQAMRSRTPWTLTGMALRTGHWVRPLLPFPKKELIELAQTLGWIWREDESNTSKKYARNRMRHEVLPLLEDIRPGTAAHLQHLGERMQELTLMMAPLLDEAAQRAQPKAGQWSLKVLQTDAWAREALRGFLRTSGWGQPLADQVLDLSTGAHQVGAVVAHRGFRMVLERDHLCWQVFSPEKKDTATGLELAWRGEGIEIAELGTRPGQGPPRAPLLNWTVGARPQDPGKTPLNACWIPRSWFPLQWRTWRAGDRIQPLGMQGQSKVSDVLTQAKVPHHLRTGVHVLERTSDQCILWVGGLKLSEHARLDAYEATAEPGAWFHLEHVQPLTSDA
jgi:tRNA(Ile)-lysidine synthase